MPYKEPERRKEYFKKYRLAHREKFRAYNKVYNFKWRWEHHEQYLATERKYRKRNRERINQNHKRSRNARQEAEA